MKHSKRKIVLITHGALGQGGVLNQADLSLLIGFSAGTVGKYIKEFQLEHGVALLRYLIAEPFTTLVRNVPTPDDLSLSPSRS
jgi:hypothetical protein